MAPRFGLMRRMLIVACAFGLTEVAALAIDQLTPAGDAPSEVVSPLQAPFQGMTGDDLFVKLIEHNRLRDARLEQYSAVRTYEVISDAGKVYAEEVVRVDYRAPDHKAFVTDSEKGSRLVRNLVLRRLIESESEASSGRAHHDSSISPANYTFNLLGEQGVGPYRCFVVEAIPKRSDKYLFEGNIWIDTEDFAIVKIAGRPARSLSFWIKRADFVRQYQRIGEFWLPAKDETLVDVRLYGKRILTINHRDYVVNGGRDGNVQSLHNQKPSSDHAMLQE